MRRWRTPAPFGKTLHSDLLTLLVGLIFTIALLFIHYQISRSYVVNVGDLGDGPLLSGFYADEPDIGYRYRWTTGHSEVRFDSAGSAPLHEVRVTAQGPRTADASSPVTMTVAVNGVPLYPSSAPQSAVVTLTEQLKPYSFSAPPEGNNSPRGPFVVSIDTSTFQPRGDARTLGAKIDEVVVQRQENALNLPPMWLVLWGFAWTAGLICLLGVFPLGRTRLYTELWLFPLLAALILYFGLTLSETLVATYLPPVAAVVGILGLLVWQHERVARWYEAVDALGALRVASVVMLAAMLVYAVFALWVIPQVDWIGHADYAENAVIARNLVSGNGLTVDYMAQFYRGYGPGISHPADTWPLLQPLMIAPFFAVLGAQTWVAKLPNLFLLLGLVWAVFSLASRLWDARVGLFAGLLTLVHAYFFNAVLYPINDLAFTLIFFCLAWVVWRLLPGEGYAGAKTRDLLLAGALVGLLIWSKPSGAALLVGLGVCALLAWRRSGAGLRALPWRGLAILAGATFVVLLPLLVRNLLAFRAPFYSTESLDAWLLRYWPLHDWEDIYKYYIGSADPPHPRWIVGGKFGYQNLFDAIGVSFQWLWQKGVLGAPGQGDYVMGLMPLAGALVGIAALDRRARSLFGMVGLSIGLYGIFVLLYWHFEGRYFQVAVPWLYMLLAYAVFWVWDRLRERVREGTAPRFGLLLLPLLVVALLWPSLEANVEQVQSDTAPTGFVQGMEWLKAHSADSDVVMTRDPWELNWYTGRKAVMIPNDDLSTIERTMRQYGATMLQLGGPVDGIDVRRCPNTTGSRPALDGLYCGQERPGYALQYREGGLTIYRLVGK